MATASFKHCLKKQITEMAYMFSKRTSENIAT